MEEVHEAPDFARLSTYFAPEGINRPLMPVAAGISGRDTTIAAPDTSARSRDR